MKEITLKELPKEITLKSFIKETKIYKDYFQGTLNSNQYQNLESKLEDCLKLLKGSLFEEFNTELNKFGIIKKLAQSGIKTVNINNKRKVKDISYKFNFQNKQIATVENDIESVSFEIPSFFEQVELLLDQNHNLFVPLLIYFSSEAEKETIQRTTTLLIYDMIVSE